MIKPVYILSGCAISPQQSYDAAQFLQPVLTSNNGQFYVADPDYRQFINPVAIRRMSRQLKMGITAGMRALQLASILTPDAIITGTGLGSMTDTEHFLKDMIALDEATLNPTYFIQSTYNSINGWLAQQSKCTGYNQTYVNRGLSMEMALLDAQMLLNETGDTRHALVGGFDEMTPEYHLVKSKIGYWKKEAIDSNKLFAHSNTPGTIAGEGASFFVLANEQKGICQLRGVHQIQDVQSQNIEGKIKGFLQSVGLELEDIDLIISGANGDSRHIEIYQTIESMGISDTGIVRYKQWTGEYPTSSGFGLWLALQVMQEQAIPMWKETSRPVRKVLVVNYYLLGTVGIMLLEK